MMWSSITSCIRRHKKKLIFLGGVVGGIAILNSYLKKKLTEWETQRTVEICEQLKRSTHFENTMKTCDNMCISFASKIRQMVTKSVDIPPIVEKLKTNPPDKVDLWDELKVLVFTQAIGEMYSQCLLCILLRVQMCILSGYIYTSQSSNCIDNHQKYMSRIEDFILNGISKLLIRIKKTVTDMLKSIPLNRSLKLEDVSQIIDCIQNSITDGDSDDFKSITCYLMPSSSSNVSDDEFVDRISEETRDVIECYDFSRVLQGTVDCGVSLLMDLFSECYVILGEQKNEFVNPHDYSAPLAKLVTVMHNVFSQHTTAEQNSLVQTVLQLDSLNNFAANIYESFSQKCVD